MSVGRVVKLVVEIVECSADASSSRRTLYDQTRQEIREMESQVLSLIVSYH
jgi:hypothetical protein